ncbi:MAG: hypothetical protein ISN29_09785 [Gammaproteobacteria bacterium AqS3]|nr:hypothetical protein [Gammaproteobacteria bacterium AqS3]
MKKLTVIFLSALLPMSLAFAGQEPIPVDDLDYAFAGEVLAAEPLSEAEMLETQGEAVVVALAVIGLALGAFQIGYMMGSDFF